MANKTKSSRTKTMKRTKMAMRRKSAKSKKPKKTSKFSKKTGGSSYNMPISYFGKPRQSSFTSNADETTKCPMPKNSAWNCFKSDPTFMKF